MKITLVLLITLCLLSGNMEIVSGMKMGGNALENIAAAAAEHQVATIAKNRNEETVETKMGCGCKCGCQVPADFLLSEVAAAKTRDGGMDLPMDCGCDCACE